MHDPIAGPLFQQASRVEHRGIWRRQERRLLLLLLAGYQDAGYAPSVADLAKRLGVPGSPNVRARIIDQLLAALETAGLVTVARWWPARNRYTLNLDPTRRTRGSGRGRRSR